MILDMSKPIKYHRFSETHDANTIQKFFDKLIIDGWHIIYYDELKLTGEKILVTIIGEKKQNNVL